MEAFENDGGTTQRTKIRRLGKAVYSGSEMSDMLQEALIKSSTRSVGLNLARRFNAGSEIADYRRVVTNESRVQASLRDAGHLFAFLGLEKAGLNSSRRYASKT